MAHTNSGNDLLDRIQKDLCFGEGLINVEIRKVDDHRAVIAAVGQLEIEENDGGIFWFDEQGIYHEWNGVYLYNDHPVHTKDTVIEGDY